MPVPEKPTLASIRAMMRKEGRDKFIGEGHGWLHHARAVFLNLEEEYSHTMTPPAMKPEVAEKLARYRKKLFVDKRIKLSELDAFHKLVQKVSGRR